MLKGKDRLCDVCGEAIGKGEKYAVVTVPKAKAGLFHALAESGPDMAPTKSVDPQGNLRLDVCLDCRLNMNFPGRETVQ